MRAFHFAAHGQDTLCLDAEHQYIRPIVRHTTWTPAAQRGAMYTKDQRTTFRGDRGGSLSQENLMAAGEPVRCCQVPPTRRFLFTFKRVPISCLGHVGLERKHRAPRRRGAQSISSACEISGAHTCSSQELNWCRAEVNVII